MLHDYEVDLTGVGNMTIIVCMYIVFLVIWWQGRLSHIFKNGGLKDWLFQLICGAWIVRRMAIS